MTLNWYGIPVKSVTVHDSDFVQQNVASTKINTFPNIKEIIQPISIILYGSNYHACAQSMSR
jgi:hypothetical protein